MKILISVVFLALGSFGESCGDKISNDYITTLLNQTSISSETQIVRRGCYSWHGGVCGCDRNQGRAICCDNTLSPSCGCN
jgi:hypothetical protein